MWTKIKMLDSKWKILIFALLFVLVWIGGSWINDRIVCGKTVKLAETAWSERNFEDAEFYYHELTYGDCPNRPFTSSGISMDQMRLGEIEGYTRAVKQIESGNYYLARSTLQHYLEYPGEFHKEAEFLLSDVYRSLAQDTGQEGGRLMLEMYEASCGPGESELPPVDTIASTTAEIKYWYPEATLANTLARMPAEFRIAVCFKPIQTEIVETCVYNQSGSAGAGGLNSFTFRKSATYEIELKDILTDKILATYQPIYSKPPAACPKTMTGTAESNEIIGMPDLSAAASWIEEQIRLLK